MERLHLDGTPLRAVIERLRKTRRTLRFDIVRLHLDPWRFPHERFPHDRMPLHEDGKRHLAETKTLHVDPKRLPVDMGTLPLDTKQHPANIGRNPALRRPRSFPVHNAVFYFPDLPWAGVGENDPVGALGSWYAGPPMPANPVPGILLTSHWWSTRRKIELHATVPLATPAPDAREVPDAAEPVRRKLRELGPFRPPELRVVLERGEGLTPADSNRQEEIVQSWDAALPTLLDALPLPHAFPPSPGMSWGSGLTSPHKATLVSTFHPRGWKYLAAQSGHGGFALVKPSPHGNKIIVFLDVGSTSHSCSSFVALEGLGWRAAFRIAFVRGHRGPQYPIADDTTWGRIVENIAVVVEHLEQTSIAEAEALSPTAPAWFATST